MTECESVRGKWGGICPSCGQRLPNPGPIRSWMASRDHREDRVRQPLQHHKYRIVRSPKAA